MLIDITLRITPKMVNDAQGNEKKALSGHLGTHFDVMNKEFPLEYTERAGIVFDVSGVKGRDISSQDIDINKVQKGMFVAFYTGFIEERGYGGKIYFSEHPQLSNELIDELLSKKVSIIGIDFAGVRRGKEHPVKDQYCADQGVFIVENLCNLLVLCKERKPFTICTYPMNFTNMTGIPCRVIANM
ncbi:MAG TPA: cyclase [Ruminococcaceae bacterium]|nr:cyclase [Oscillospiraceae bacterium]